MAVGAQHDHTFTGVVVHKRNHVYVSSISDEFSPDDDHALVFRWFGSQWAHRSLAFAVGSMCQVNTDERLVLCMGINGEINLFTNPGAAGAATEQVDTSDEGPSDLLHLKSIRLIGKHVYVAGMGRRVYRRESTNRWLPVDQGLFLRREQRGDKAIGINAIDGLTEKSIYAVGYQGEIWFYDGKVWIQQDSPTNVALTCVRCLSDGYVYAGGMAGTLLRGRAGQWESIVHDATDNDFWGMAFFNEKLYLANYDGVFLLDGDVLTPVRLGPRRDGTKLSTAYLDTNDGVLWSVGQKDLAYTDDGTNWVEVSPPN